MLYPLKFQPILKSTIWGGNKIIPFKHLDSQQQNVGESWEISNVPGDVSVVANGPLAGKTLSELVSEYKGEFLGKRNYERFGDNFPLLIKFIDAADDLSIQVHPDDELAMKRHASMGKTEMWYVVDNNNNTARLRSGLKRSITPAEYEAMVADNTICDALAEYEVNAGDVVAESGVGLLSSESRRYIGKILGVFLEESVEDRNVCLVCELMAFVSVTKHICRKCF